MSNAPLQHPLSPQEIARRQRWVAVGVTILAILMIATWLITLPYRFGKTSQDGFFSSLVGNKTSDVNYIDVDSVLNSEKREIEREEMLQQINSILESNTATSTASTTPSVTEAPTTSTTPATTTQQ